MPIVAITIRRGRTTDQLRALVFEVTDAVARSLDVAPERVRVHIHELEPDRMAVGGRLASDAVAAAER